MYTGGSTFAFSTETTSFSLSLLFSEINHPKILIQAFYLFHFVFAQLKVKDLKQNKTKYIIDDVASVGNKN